MDTNTVQAIISASNNIASWSLSLLGATLLAVLSSSYIKPLGKWSKLIYLLFIPGWVFLALSIKCNDTITRRGIAATIDPNRIPSIVDKMNDEFALQLKDFNIALYLFGLWLLLFLLWWISKDFFIKPNKQ
jgi:hypothetical protein